MRKIEEVRRGKLIQIFRAKQTEQGLECVCPDPRLLVQKLFMNLPIPMALGRHKPSLHTRGHVTC